MEYYRGKKSDLFRHCMCYTVSVFDEKSGNIVYRDGNKDKDQICGLTPCIKNNTAKEQYSIAPFCGTNKIHRKEYGDEPEQKKKA